MRLSGEQRQRRPRVPGARRCRWGLHHTERLVSLSSGSERGTNTHRSSDVHPAARPTMSHAVGVSHPSERQSSISMAAVAVVDKTAKPVGGAVIVFALLVGGGSAMLFLLTGQYLMSLLASASFALGVAAIQYGINRLRA